jgi:Flp pilus assembly protein TadD
VSYLLDSLRKANRERPRDGVGLSGNSRAALVISSLGLAPRRRRRIPLSGLIVVAVMTSASLAAGSLSRRPASIWANEIGVVSDKVEKTAGPADPSVDFARAVAFQQAGEFPRAIAIYNALLARDEMPAEAHNNLGLIHEQRGQLDEAAREFESALAHDPRYSRAHDNLGLMLLAQGRPAEAAARFQRAAVLDGRDPGPLTNLALAHKAAGRLDQARESLLAALAISPRSAPAHYNLAVLYDRSGERARAAGHYRAFLEHRGGDHASLAADVTARLAALDAAR